jgi:hypothetical protein
MGFRSEKIPRNRPGMVSVIPRKKVLIPRGILRFTEESIPKFGTEWNLNTQTKIVLKTAKITQFNDLSVPQKSSNASARNSEILLLLYKRNSES